MVLSKGEPYTKTLLERAKGSALDIITRSLDPIGAINLLPPHNQQIKYLEFEWARWEEIQRFSEVNSGPFPLLHILKVCAFNEVTLDGQPDTMTPPSLPLFTSAVNLKEFVLHSQRFPFLNHFVFPNLTTFELSAMPGRERFRVSELLDFLEASPMLRTARMKIIADLELGGVPRERVIVLPNVEAFSLIVNDGEPGFIITTHISCPFVRKISLIHEKVANDTIPREIFPASASWNTILHQYTRSLVESIALEIKMDRDPVFTSSLLFRFSDAAIVELGFRVSASDDDEDFQMSRGELHDEAFLQAHRVIQDHPSLAKVKSLYIHHRKVRLEPEERINIANEVGRLFESLGTLDELIMYGCDLRLYVTPFLDRPSGNGLEHPLAFPVVKEFRISHPIAPHNREECTKIIVELAKSQNALGIPFERVTVCMERLPKSMVEMLRPWVGVVDFYEDFCMEYP